MTKPLCLLVALVGLFEICHVILGYDLVYAVGYGTFAVLALVISVTFLWLWTKRSTPLALGMAFSWFGAAGVMSWWWLFNVLDAPNWMQDSPVLFVFLSIYLVGAILHLEVIGRSFALTSRMAYAPVLIAAAVSVFAALLA